MKLKLYLLSILLFFVLLPVLYVFAAGIDSVSLVSPGNDTLSSQDNDTITFTFNFTGDNATASCVIYVTNSTSDFVAVGENTTVLNVTNTDIQSNASISEGVRQWYVNCTNSTTIQSAIWTLNVDLTNPVVNIIIPGNTTYASDPELNFSYTETNNDSCWYSINGAANVTLATCNTNGTTLASSEGGNNVRLCMNDTVGHEGCNQVYYTKDTTNPTVTVILPSNTTYATQSMLFNVSLDENGDACLVNYGFGNETMTSTDNIYWNYTNTSMNDGAYQAIFYCNDSGSNLGSNNIYFTVDTTYPVIENVTSGSVTFSTAIVTWDTNENANSSVGYGTTLALGSTSSATSLVTSHSRTLTSLASSTLYYYNVTSCDQAGNCNESGPYNFTTSVCSESWSCGEWSVCVGGLQTRGCTDSNSCGTTASRPSLSQECISGGGTSKPKPPEVRHAWSKITPGVEALMSIDKSGLDFTEIRISVKNQANQVSITVTKIEGSPADVEKEVSGKTYQYIRIQESNLDDANIEKSKIKFKVSKTWISENSINELTVGLNRYTDDWIELPTTLTSEDDDYFYYEAETPGFSVFAITGKEIVCTSDEMRCSGNELQKCTSDGTDWETTEICEYGCDSASLSCKSQGACEAEEMRCSGKTLQKCSTYTYDWETLETCEYQCLDNKCTEAAPDYSGLYIGVVVIVMIILLFVWMKPKSLKKMFKKK